MKNLMQKKQQQQRLHTTSVANIDTKKTINGFFEGFFWVLREICVYKLMSSEEN